MKTIFTSKMPLKFSGIIVIFMSSSKIINKPSLTSDLVRIVQELIKLVNRTVLQTVGGVEVF